MKDLTRRRQKPQKNKGAKKTPPVRTDGNIFDRGAIDTGRIFLY
jgi:hypothetical protein